MNDPGLVVHKRRLLSVETSGIVPHPEAPSPYFFDSRVSADSDVSGWSVLFMLPSFALVPASVSATNGEGVGRTFGVGGEG